MTRQGRRFSAQEKVAILRRHLFEKVPISELCDEHHLAPNLFYRWQKEFFGNGAAAFERDNGTEVRHLKNRGEAIWAERDRKLAEARAARAARRAQARLNNAPSEALTSAKETPMLHPAGETDAGSAGEHPARDSRLGRGRKAGAGMALRDDPRAPLEPFGLSPDASENSGWPQDSRPSESLMPTGHLSSSR